MLKLNRKEKLLFFSPALLLLVPLWNHFKGDMMTQAQRKLAGSEAINCGVGHILSIENNEIDVKRDEVDACSVMAFKARKPFIARYDTDDPDLVNAHSFGITGTPDGKVYFAYYENTSYWWSEFMNWRSGTNRWSQAACNKPKLYPQRNKAGKIQPNAVIGCGTCENYVIDNEIVFAKDVGAATSATCILFKNK